MSLDPFAFNMVEEMYCRAKSMSRAFVLVGGAAARRGGMHYLQLRATRRAGNGLPSRTPIRYPRVSVLFGTLNSFNCGLQTNVFVTP